MQELLRVAGLHPGQQTALKRVLRELVRSGEVLKDGKRFWVKDRPAQPAPSPRKAPAPVRKGAPARKGGARQDDVETVEGLLHVHRDGFGFVHPLTGDGENIYLPAHEAARAVDNDRVVVEVTRKAGGRTEGHVVRVVDRRRQFVVGTYTERGRKEAFVLPQDTSLQGPIRVPRTQMAREGDMVKVRLGVGAELIGPGEGLFGEVAGSLGKPGDPSVEVLSIAYSQGFADEFPPEVMDEADAFEPRVKESDAVAEGRRDLRKLALITIDGEDARDFDDAVYAEPHPKGWRLVVAIADVSHYVTEGTALDAEALRRATSVYLPDRVLPMLPERLSNGICSLKPDENRLCMVADMVLDARGALQQTELYPAVMRSAARCTYNEVQDVLDGKTVPHRMAFKPHFERLLELSRVLTQMRRGRGAIDFDLPEFKIILDEEGKPARMERRERADSHRLIEECMLAANEAVAKFFQDLELPSVYRFHGEPNEEKLAAFAQLAEAHGFHIDASGDVSSKDLNAFISKLAGHPEQRALNQLLLRSMMQAVYSSTQVGHYGLGAEHYLHFTSPIRRYPDLLVHRLLKAHWARGKKKRSESALETEEEKLEQMAQQSSDRERAAMSVEREVVSFYAALLMKDRVGEEFAATVASVTDFGFFVELDEVHVEGLVKAEALGPGSKLDKVLHALVYPNGRRVRVGQQLRVTLISVNLQRRQIDFEPLQFDGEEPLEAGAGEGASPRGNPLDRFKRTAKKGKAAFTPRPPREAPARKVHPTPRRAPVREDVGPIVSLAPPKPAWKAAAVAEPRVSEDSPHPGFDRIRALAAQRRAPAPGPSAFGGARAPSRGEPPQRPRGKGKGKATAVRKGTKGGKGKR